MASPKSNLIPIEEDTLSKNPRTFKGYTSAEKRRLFPIYDTLKIRSVNDLHNYISIFGEKFDIGSCVKTKKEKEEEEAKEAQEAEAKEEQEKLVRDGKVDYKKLEDEADRLEAEAAKEAKAKQEKEAIPGPLDKYEGVFLGSPTHLIELPHIPVTYQTRKDFDKLYLSDMNDKEKKIMRKLYMFIFGDQLLNTVSPDFADLRIAFTNLSPYEKVPCHQNTALLEALKKSIQSRIKLLKEEIKQLETAFMGPNLNIDMKTKLLFNLTTFLDVLIAKKRHCILYSAEGDLTVKAEDNDWIYRFLKNHWIRLHSEKVPETEDEKKKYYEEIRDSVDVAKKGEQPSQDAYNDMLRYALQEYNNMEAIRNRETTLMTRLKTPHLLEKVDSVQNSLITSGAPPPKGAAAPSAPAKGGGTPDSIEDIREEMGRVIHTAMNHLKLMKPRDREEALSTTLELLTGKGDTLEQALSSVRAKEPEWHSSTYAALDYKLGSIKGSEPFLQAIKHLLFLKEEELQSMQYEFRDIPYLLKHIEPGQDRFYAVLRRHPSLYEVIPKDILLQSKQDLKSTLKRVEEELPAIYPYSSALLADIYAVEEGPNIRSLGESIFLHIFTSLGPVKKTRAVFDELTIDAHLLERILKQVDTHGPIDVEAEEVKELLRVAHTLPEGIQDKLRKAGPPIEVTVNEKVFIKPSDVHSDGISVGMLFFLYLFIKFANVLDEPSDS